MKPSTLYTWHDFSLAVQHNGPQTAATLAELLHDLSWVRTEDWGRQPTLRLTVHWDDRWPRVPPTAREVFRAEGFWGLDGGDEFYLTDGASLLHLQVQQGCGEAWLAPDFAAKPRNLQRNFWAFGLLKLLRPLGLYSLHAAGVVSERGRGLLIVGCSGSGKSTLALGLLRQGWSLLSDDAMLLRRQPTGIEALACRRHVYVHAEAAARYADLPLGEEVPDGAGGCKRRVSVEMVFPEQQLVACRPRALLFAHIVSQPRSTLHPVDAPNALGQLLAHSGPQLLDRQTIRPHLAVLRQLLQQATVYELHAGRDLYDEPRTVVHLLCEAEGAARWPVW